MRACGIRRSGARGGIGILTLALAGQFALAQPAWAAVTVDLAVADLTAAAAASAGAFTVTGPTLTDDLLVTGDVVLTGTGTAGRIVRVSGGTAQAPRQLTLQGTSLAVGSETRAAIQLDPGAHARLKLVAGNHLTGSATYPALGIPVGASVELTADSTAGTLAATGSGHAAAIGGNGKAVLVEPALIPITLTGKVEASCGALTISGGTVNASITDPTGTGAAIGGGRFGNGCTVTITNGRVNATASAGAGIGGGSGKDGANGYSKDSPGGDGGAVTITGGTVSATSVGSAVFGESNVRQSAAIGGGRGGGGGAETQGTDGAPGTLTITGGSVKLEPGESSMAPAPRNGSDNLAQVKVPNAAGVSQVVVTPQGGTAMPSSVSANHDGDDAVYLFLPYPKTYSVAVTAAGVTTTYRAVLSVTGAPVTAYVPAPDPANLSAAPLTFPDGGWGRAVPDALPVAISNTGGTAAVIVDATVAPADLFTVTKPASVSVPAGGSDSSITVQPAANLAVGVHQATLTLSYGSGLSLTVPISFTVTGAPSLQVEAPSLASVVVGSYTATARDITITNVGTTAAVLTGVTSSNPADFPVTTSTATLQPLESVIVTVVPSATLGIGTHQATITATFDGGMTATATVSLTVSPRPVVAVKAGQTKVELKKGSTIALSAYGYEASGVRVPVTWSTSSASIATVSAGKIKAVRTGTAKITVTARGKSTSITVKVVSKSTSTKVKSVSAKVPKTMKVKAIAYTAGKFSPDYTRNAKLTYSSSKKSVVTVDAAGTLIAMKKGKATITVKAGKKSKKYTVTVK